MKLIRYEYPQSPNMNEFDRLFNELWGGFSRWPGLEGNRAFQPAADLYEDDSNHYVRFELPGFKRDQIHLELENAVLTVTAERKGETGEGHEAQTVSRSITVSEDIQVDAVSARFEDGVLTVTLPKHEAVRPRQIEVQ